MNPQDTLKLFKTADVVEGLTVATITHDGAAKDGTLARMLASVALFAWQIVLVDTSEVPSDAVAALAAQYNADLTHCPWPDSFAEARNAATPLIKGTWCLVVDSDEEVSADAAELRRVMQATHADAFAVRLLNHTERGSASMEILRLYRVSCGMTWASRVHEYVTQTRDGTMRVGGSISAVKLSHVGHSDAEAVKNQKLAKRQRLARLDAEEHPDDLYRLYVLAQLEDASFTAAKLWQQVVSSIRAEPFKLLTDGWRRHALVAAVAFHVLVAENYEAARLEKPAEQAWARVVDLAAECRAMLPGRGDVGELGGADLRYMMAKALLKCKDPAGALDVLEPVMGLDPQPPYSYGEAAFTGRMLVYLRALYAVRDCAQIPYLCEQLTPKYQAGGDLFSHPDAGKILAELAQLKADATEYTKQALSFLDSHGVRQYV